MRRRLSSRLEDTASTPDQPLQIVDDEEHGEKVDPQLVRMIAGEMERMERQRPRIVAAQDVYRNAVEMLVRDTGCEPDAIDRARLREAAAIAADCYARNRQSEEMAIMPSVEALEYFFLHHYNTSYQELQRSAEMDRRMLGRKLDDPKHDFTTAEYLRHLREKRNNW